MNYYNYYSRRFEAFELPYELQNLQNRADRLNNVMNRNSAQRDELGDIYARMNAIREILRERGGRN